MEHLLDDFLDRAHLRVHEHIGLLIERLAFGEQFTDLRHRVRTLKKRAVGLSMDPLPNNLGGSPEADHQRVLLQTCHIFLVRGQPAARGDDCSLRFGQFGNDLLFNATEDLLRDAAPSPRLDQFISINKAEMKMSSQRTPHGRFPRAHESDQGQIVDRARRVHWRSVCKNGSCAR